MTKIHVELFCHLVREKKTLRCIRREMQVDGCDLSSYDEPSLVKNMLRVLRDQPTQWET